MKWVMEAEDWKPVLKKLDEIKKEILMATQEGFSSVVDRLNKATNSIADELSSLKEQIKSQGLPQSDEDSILATLDGAVSRLEALGANSANPVPLDNQPGTGSQTAPATLGSQTSPAAGTQVEGSQGSTSSSPSSTGGTSSNNTSPEG